MNRRVRLSGPSIYVMTALMGLTGCPISASAADAPADAPVTVASADASADYAAGGGAFDEVVVTAQKRKENIQAVPVAITAISSDKLQENNLKQASDIALFVPNFSAVSSGRTSPRWFLRGVGVADGTTSPIGIYSDDVYLSNTLITNFPLFDLERVEVLRGPQGTLWGKNTTAGAINFISKKPEFDPSGFAKLQYGNYGFKEVEGAYGGAISDDKVAARIAFHGDFSDGYATNQHDGSKVGDVTEIGVRGQVLAHVNETLDALINVHYDYFNAPGATLVNRGISTRADKTNGFGYVFPTTDPDYFNSIGPSHTTIDHQGAFLNLTQQIDDLTLVSITAIDRLKYSSQAGTLVPQELTRTEGETRDQQISEELRLSSPRTDRFNWIVGAHYFFEKLDGANASAILPGTTTPTFQDIVNTTKTTSYAAFASGTYSFTDDLRLTAGLRETRETKANRLRTFVGVKPVAFSNPTEFWLLNAVSSPLTVAVRQNDSSTWTALTYDITPEYDITDNARVFFRHAKGFRSGGFNNTAASQGSVAIVNPEVIKDYEGGIKTEWFGKRLIANAAIFDYDYSNIQINVVTPTGVGGTFVSTIRNAGAGYSRGIELELRALPIDNLEIDGSIGLLRTRYTQFQFSSTSSAVGNQFVRAPHVSATLGAHYTIPLSFGGSIVLATDWQYRSKFFYNATTQTPLLTERALTIGNIEASYVTEDERWEFQLYSQNVTNERYPTTVLPTSYGGSSFESAPRTYGASVTAKF